MTNQEERKNELALFAGIGGGILGTQLLGHTTVCAVEILEYNRSVLIQRQLDGLLPRFPIWDDVRTFDGTPWRGLVDLISGGFPCQDISQANIKAEGIAGHRSGLWVEFARIIREVQPRQVFVENSPMLATRGLDVVLRDLTEMGYRAAWAAISSADTGAHQKRQRLWVLAEKTMACDDSLQPISPNRDTPAGPESALAATPRLATSRLPAPILGGATDEAPVRVGPATALGNAQDPVLAAVAFEHLSQALRRLVPRE